MRAIGVLGSAELSIALTNGAAQLPALKIDPQMSGKPVLVRVWRGTATGVYDKFITIPVIAGGVLIDNGTDLNGFVWSSWGPGAAGSCNGNYLTKGYELDPGVWDPTYQAYGRVRVWTDQSTFPVSDGSWRAGDEVLLRVPFATGGKLRLGWRRLTDDDDWGHNSLYTHWMPIYAGHPVLSATTTEFGSATSTVNTIAKSYGAMVMNSTTGKPMFALGATSTSAWVYADGTGTITPT
jgi:hypothetical protein